eukprot:15237034-Ditylum_brightwellii.AAC.1
MGGVEHQLQYQEQSSIVSRSLTSSAKPPTELLPTKFPEEAGIAVTDKNHSIFEYIAPMPDCLLYPGSTTRPSPPGPTYQHTLDSIPN